MSTRRIFAISSPFLLIFFLVHFFAPDENVNTLYGKGGLLPSFGGRASSRRTDQYVRNAKKARFGIGNSDKAAAVGLGPANFSEPAPFTFCPSYGATDVLGSAYGPAALSKTRVHLGSGERIKKVLRRAMAGLPITVGVLGGSVSSCHGLDATVANPLGNPIGVNCYPRRIFDWLNDVFPHPANELTNGALRRTGTSYFGFCSDIHLPDRVDLVVLEFDTEDPNDSTTLGTMDLLVRSLLMRPDQPAVIMLGHFSPQIQGEHGFAGPEIWHTSVAQFYDVVHLSTKGLLYEEYLANPTKIRHTYYLDPILANAKGHELLADTLIAYLESEICQIWESAALEADLAALSGGNAASPLLGDDLPALLAGKGLKKAADNDDGENHRAQGGRSVYANIPPFRITDKPHTLAHFREIKPNCASANDLINPLPSSVFAGSGWTPVVPRPEEEDETHYWYSDMPGSLIKIPIKCGAGDVAVYYHQGPQTQGWGNVLCWVDDNTEGAVLLTGSWDKEYGQSTVTQVDKYVTAGPHYVVCELQGQPGIDQAKFKLFGIFST